jgi:hypothetical protein
MPVLCGSCLCGGVKYEVEGPLLRPLNCHCSMCRKAQGTAFRSCASVKISDFKWVQGEELMTHYESSPGFKRGFCRVCGSPIINGSPAHPELGYTLLWERSTATPDCAQSGMSLSQTRHRGSRSPMISLSTRSGHL